MMKSANRAALVLAMIAIALPLLAGCEAGDPRFSADDPAGFWAGLLHGIIALPAWIIGLFVEQVEMYERANNGAWYDVGFLLGIGMMAGGGGHGAKRSRGCGDDG